jgi:serine/threonine protein kinase
MEYIEYGSLHDLLNNETMHAGGEIILQILRDVSQGLRFLHSSKPPILVSPKLAQSVIRRATRQYSSQMKLTLFLPISMEISRPRTFSLIRDSEPKLLTLDCPPKRRTGLAE